MPKRPLQQRRSEVMFFPKPEGIFPTGVNNHSQLSSFIHPSWSKCFLQRWLIHELGIWMKSKHYLWIFQVVLWAGPGFYPIWNGEKLSQPHM
jgi:hypothetical protein